MTVQERLKRPVLSQEEVGALLRGETDAPTGEYRITGDDWAEAMAEVKGTASLDFEAKPQLSIGELTHLFRHRLHEAQKSEEFHRGQATAYFEVVNALERVIAEREASTGDGK